MEPMPNTTTIDAWETVNRVVFPVKDQNLTLPLYVTDWRPTRLDDTVLDSRLDTHTVDFRSMNRTALRRIAAQASGQSRDAAMVHGEILGRRSVAVAPKSQLSSCTFFNAFPAAYWRRWTTVGQVRFRGEFTGTGEVTIVKSTGRGLYTPVARIPVTADGNGSQRVEAVIALTNLVDGGYLWFDVANTSADEPLVVDAVEWQVPLSAKRFVASGKPASTLSIAITTFNRPSYCLDLLRDIAADATLRERLDTVYCVDQGDDHVSDQPGYARVADDLGAQLTYLRQRNLGGSGGYSRGMLEAVDAGRSDFVLLHDDDAITEPEAVLRALQFADYTLRPTLVGGGMFHLDNRTVLYTQGERLDPHTVWMKSSLGLAYNHDFAARPLRESPERHQRIDADYNGWWMCLIPVSVIRRIGLSLPVFIKFDDTEYCIRAKEHGFPTVCLPGVAVWHQAWHDKDPARTWEEYFFQRNRWIFALLHRPAPTFRMMVEMLAGDCNAGLRFLYSAIRLRHKGLEDILRGPDYIVSSMPGKLAEVRRERGRFEDSRTSRNLDDFPEPASQFVSPSSRPSSRLRGARIGALAVVREMCGRTDASGAPRPDVAIPAKDAFWKSFVGVDSALVTTPDGDAVSWLRRDDRRFREGVREGLALSWRFLRAFPRLSRQYREYDMAGFAVWRRIFTADRND